MQLGRFQVSTLRPSPILSITFSQDGKHFSVATETGYEVWRTFPLGLVRRRVLTGTLSLAFLLPFSPLVVLQGGGNNPLYPPNKAVVFHDGLGIPVAEMEFGERIRGITARLGIVCIALSRKVIAFSYDTGSRGENVKGKGKQKVTHGSAGLHMSKLGEWETALNEKGLMAISTSPGSSLLALPGRQPGHVQLIHLTPCPHPASAKTTDLQSAPTTAFRSPIILAHTHTLSTLSCNPSGTHILTSSERGTLLRVWDTGRGRLERELRRGVDRAEMWGLQFDTGDGSGDAKGKGGQVVGWSDKGTVHVWDDGMEVGSDGVVRPATPTHQPSLTNLLSRNLPLPKYFSSQASSSQYHLPRKNPHAISSATLHRRESSDTEELSEKFVVGWISVEVDIPEPAVGEVKFEKKSAMGMSMGTREERRSFGSDTASTRTPTPTLYRPSGGRDTPVQRRRSSNTNTASHLRADSAGSTATATSESRGKARVMAGKKVVERQLVAITYSGDWYRLRIPDRAVGGDENEVEGEGKEKRGKGGKCELVEYRRLGVGGGGW